jgi:hypothetical protein
MFHAVIDNNAGDDSLCSYSLTDADAGKVTDETRNKSQTGWCLTDADAGRGTDEKCSMP